MTEQPFKFPYELPPQVHDYLNKTWNEGDLVTLIPPELRDKHKVPDFSIYEDRTLFDGSPFSAFKPHIKAFQYGAQEAYFFIDTCGYFDGPEKEWERINMYWYMILRWDEVGHHCFLENYAKDINQEKWLAYITQFLTQFPDNPRVQNDQIDYLRITGEIIKSFELSVALYNKYQVGDFFLSLKRCYWEVRDMFEGVPEWLNKE